jgi:hypothetical protein
MRKWLLTAAVSTLFGHAYAQSTPAEFAVTTSGSESAETLLLSEREVEPVSLKAFGAKCDGRTDDTAAITKAASSGRALLVPRGVCVYSSGMVLPRKGAATLIGYGPMLSTLKYTGQGAAISFDTSVVNIVRAPLFRDFQIDASRSTATHGLHLSNKSDGNGLSWGEVRNIYAVGSKQPGSFGVRADGVVYTTFTNIVARAWDTGFHFGVTGRPSSNNTIHRSVAMDYLSAGFHVAASTHGLKFLDTSVEGSGRYGYDIECFTKGSAPDSHMFIGIGGEDAPTGAYFRASHCRRLTMLGTNFGTNKTGHGIELVNTRASTFSALRLGNFTGPGKYAITADEESTNNEITGYIRDARNANAIRLPPSGNRWQFDFAANAAMPYTYGSGPAQKIYTRSGGAVDPMNTGLYLADASAGDIALALGAVTALNGGVVLEVKKKRGNTNRVTIEPASRQTIDNNASLTLLYDDEVVVMRADAERNNWQVLSHYVPNPYAAIASARFLTIPLHARVVAVTGRQDIGGIAPTGWKGKVVTLVFDSSLTVTSGSNLRLVGNFSAVASATLTLVCDGTTWYEVSRSVNGPTQSK